MPTPAEHKFHSFDGTSTYTDLSQYLKLNGAVEALSINSDHTPIINTLQVESPFDYSSTTLADDTTVLITRNVGTEKVIWIGYVDSSYYDYESKTYVYQLYHIFEKLKGKTTTDIYENWGTVGVEGSSDIYHGSTQIVYRYAYAKIILEDIVFAQSTWFGGLTFELSDPLPLAYPWVLPNNMLRYLGSDFYDPDAELTEDLTTIYDFLIAVLKISGAKLSFQYAFSSGSGTPEIEVTAYATPSGDTFTSKDINKYNHNIKKIRDLKGFKINQNIPCIVDESSDIDTENTRYFSPVFYSQPYFNVKDVMTDGNDILVTTAPNHYLSNYNYTRHLAMRGIIESEIENGEDWSYESADEIRILDARIEECRYCQVNPVDSYNISKIVISKKQSSDTAHSVITVSDTSGLGSTISMSVGGFISSKGNIFAAGTYVYESGTSGDASKGKYKIIDGNTIHIAKSIDFVSTVNKVIGWSFGTKRPKISCNKTITSEGLCAEGDPSTTSPVYIQQIYRDTVTIGATTDSVLVLITNQVHNLAGSSGDNLGIFVTGNSEYDGKEWTETTSFPTSGEVYVHDTKTLYLYDNGEDELDYAKMYILPEKYKQEKILVDSKTEYQSINFADDICFYLIASLSGWQDNWKAYDLSLTEYADAPLLLSYESYDPEWLYYLSTYYQQITSYTHNLDDNPTTEPTIENSKRIAYNIGNNSIDVTQEEA